MASATTPLINPFEYCASSVSRTSYFPSSISKPSCPLIRLSTSSTWGSLKSKIFPYRVVPLAKASDWAQQEEEEESEKDVLGWEAAGDIEASGAGSFSWEGESEKEENVDGGTVEEASEDSYSEPPEEAKLFVGNLPYDVDSEKLAQLFEQSGVVEIAEVIYNRETDQSRGFGFVTMSTVEEAEKAVEMFNRYDINGRLLTVNKAAPRGSQPERTPRAFEPSFRVSQPERTPRAFEPSFRVYVGNLPWQVDNARLEQLFSEHGKVVDAKVVYDRESGRSRGFGFVTMSSESELNDAIAALDGQNLDGRAIRVNVAEERPRRSFF